MGMIKNLTSTKYEMATKAMENVLNPYTNRGFKNEQVLTDR